MLNVLQTLRLISRTSPELLDVTLANLLTALRTSSDLCLPLSPPASFEEKTTAGRLETAARALDVGEIRTLYVRSNDHDRTSVGRGYGSAFVEILQALNEGVVNSTVVLSGSGSSSSGGQVWEEGLRRVLDFLRDRTSSLIVAGTLFEIDTVKPPMVDISRGFSSVRPTSGLDL